MIILIYSLAVLLCLIGIVFNTRSPVLKYTVLVLIAYLIGRGAVTPDTVNYQIRYLNIADESLNQTYEPGYYFLQKLGSFLKLDYIQFRIIVSAIALLLIDSFVKAISRGRVFGFYLTYLLYFILIDSDQHRSFIAFSIVLFGLKFLVLPSRFLFRHKSLIFLVFTLLASLIHISTLAFASLVLLSNASGRLGVKVIVIVTLISCLFIFFSGNELTSIKLIIQLLTGNSERLAEYGVNKVRFGFLYPFVIHIISLMSIYLCCIYLSRFKNYDLYGGYDFFYLKYMANVIFLINLIALLFFPLYMFNLQFFRLGREIIMITLLVLSILAFNGHQKFIFKYYAFIGWLLLLFSLYWYTFILGNHFDDIVLPVIYFDTVLVI